MSVAISSVTGHLVKIWVDPNGRYYGKVRFSWSENLLHVTVPSGSEEALRAAWDQWVVVSGRLTRDDCGTPVRIRMDGIEVIPVREPISAKDILGIAPDWTGALTTEEWIAEARR